MGFLRSLAAVDVQDFIQNVTSVSNRYKNSFHGWKALATSCLIQLLLDSSPSKISSNQLSEIIVPFINKILDCRVQLKPYIPPQFSNIQDFESWIENEKVAIQSTKNNLENYANEKEEFIESQLTKVIRKDHLEKASQTCQEIRCVMNNLTQAEQNLLEIPPNNELASVSGGGKIFREIEDMLNFDRFQGFFKESFIRVLNQRQCTLNEVQKIMLDQGDPKTDSIADQLAFYTSMKKTLEKRELTQYSNAIDEKVTNLTSANVIMEWALEAINDMEAILKSGDMKQLVEDKEGIITETKNWKTQANTRLLQLEEVKQVQNSTIGQIRDKLEQINELADSICTKISEQSDTAKEDNIQAFTEKEQLIANSLQSILLALQGIKIEGSTLAAIEKASSNVEKILNDCEHLEKQKNEYVRLGQCVKDYHQSGADSIKDICLKWERVTNLLRDQRAKSQSLIQMWNQTESLKRGFSEDLDRFIEMYPDSFIVQENDVELASVSGNSKIFREIEDETKLYSLQEECKESIEVLRRMRHNFEQLFKCQKQLIHEMQTVPSFDTNQLKRELAQIQQKYAEMCTKQKERLFNLNKCITLLQNAEKEIKMMDQMKSQAQNPNGNLIKSMQEALTVAERAKKLVETMNEEILPKLNLNLIFLKSISEKINQFMEEGGNENETNEIMSSTQNIEKQLASVEFQMTQQYIDFKNHLSILNNLREVFEKIEAFEFDPSSSKNHKPVLKSYVQNVHRKFVKKAEELFSLVKPLENLDRNLLHDKSKNDNKFSIDLGLLKDLVLTEISLNKSFALIKKVDDDVGQNTKHLSHVLDVLEQLEHLQNDAKEAANVLQKTRQIVTDLQQQTGTGNWIPILEFVLNIVDNVVQEIVQDNAFEQVIDDIETELKETNDIQDYRLKYGKLSSLCWRLPRASEIQSNANGVLNEKMFAIFDQIVNLMQQDLKNMNENITEGESHQWLKSWLQASIDEMGFGEPFTDITHVVQGVDQTLILLNSSQYASLCVEYLNSWNMKLTNLKSNLRTDSSTKHEDWVNQLSKVESDLNGLFEEVSNDNPVQPDDVVILSRIDEMNSKLQRQMHDCRMYLAQLRSFEEKANELFSSLDTFEHLSQIQEQRRDLEQRSNRILDETAKSLNLINVTTYLKNLLIKLDEAIQTRKTSEDTVNGIVFRTKELVALGTMRPEFEDLSKALLIDINDITEANLSEHQNEQIQSCLDEVTSLLDEYEAQNALNSDMMEIAELHEELTAWLKDVEDSLQTSLDLKCNLEEKRKQLDEYKEIHADIEAHEKLVSMVFDKTSKLMAKNNDFSLATYLTSIQSLFETIKIKSSKLISQMQECIQDQEDYEHDLSSFTDFLTEQAQVLKQVLSTNTCKDSNLDINSAILMMLNKIEEGNALIIDLEDALNDVLTCTSEEGKETLEIEFKQLFSMWTKHLRQIQDLKNSLSFNQIA